MYKKETIILRGYKPPLIIKYINYPLKVFLKDILEINYKITILNNSKSIFTNILNVIKIVCKSQIELDRIIKEAENKMNYYNYVTPVSNKFIK